MPFGKGYVKNEVFDKKGVMFLAILNSRCQFTTYKIVVSKESFELYVENVLQGEEEKVIEDIKNIFIIFKKVVFSNGLEKIEPIKVIFSKGYEIADKEYKMKFCGKPVDVKVKNIGVSLRYVQRTIIPLVIYSYLLNQTDIDNFFNESSKYIDILVEADI